MTLKKDICIGVGMYVELRQDTPSIPYTIARLKRNSPSDPSGLSLWYTCPGPLSSVF